MNEEKPKAKRKRSNHSDPIVCEEVLSLVERLFPIASMCTTTTTTTTGGVEWREGEGKERERKR